MELCDLILKMTTACHMLALLSRRLCDSNVKLLSYLVAMAVEGAKECIGRLSVDTP